MRKVLKRFWSFCLAGAMIICGNNKLVSADEIISSEPVTYNLADEAVDSQEIIDTIGEGIEHIGSPEEFGAWAASELFKEIFKSKSPSKQQIEAEQIQQLLNEVNEALAKLDNISQEIANSASVQLINEFKVFDSADNTKVYTETLADIDKGNMTAEAKSISRKKVMIYSLTGTSEGSSVQDELYLSAYDGTYDKYKAFVLTPFETVNNEQMYITEMYDKLLRINKKWYHQYYKDKIAFQNYFYGKFYTVSILEKLSLIARIQAYEAEHKGESALILRNKLSDLANDVNQVMKLSAASKAFTPDPNKRYYMYPGNELTIWATAKEQVIPNEPRTDKGIQSELAYLKEWTSWNEEPLKGLNWKQLTNTTFSFSPKLEFWRSFISYNSNTLCPTNTWFENVYKNYGSSTSLYTIFFDKNEGNLVKPGGATDEWLYVADPAKPYSMKYEKNNFEADHILSPAVSSKGKTDYQVIYNYHAYSNSPETKYKYVGIGIAGGSTGEEEDINRKSSYEYYSYYNLTEEEPEEAKDEVYIDYDTNKSELPSHSVMMGSSVGASDCQDMKVHMLDAVTSVNQAFLVNDYASKIDACKTVKILANYGVYTRGSLPVTEAGKSKTLAVADLSVNPGEQIFAVCYNETDKAYLIQGIVNENKVIILNGFIARENTNVTIFALE